jgi:hypothetical protein
MCVWQVWWIIRKETIDFSQLGEEGVSPAAQDFLQCLLRKDPHERLSAEGALHHPWLADTCTGGTAPGVALSGTAVQRLQRFAVTAHLKRVVLGMITNELLASQPLRCLPPVDVLRAMFGGVKHGDNVPKEAFLVGIPPITPYPLSPSPKGIGIPKTKRGRIALERT